MLSRGVFRRKGGVSIAGALDISPAIAASRKRSRVSTQKGLEKEVGGTQPPARHATTARRQAILQGIAIMSENHQQEMEEEEELRAKEPDGVQHPTVLGPGTPSSQEDSK